jgi:hypothetical protein
MAKITRVTQKQFATGAGIDEITVFGSLAAGSLAYSVNPATIQSLSEWVDGWFSAVLDENSPAIEDMNAMFFVICYQLAYLMQAGIPEWDAGTTYYIGSLVNSGGVVYTSIADNNLNHAVTNASFWRTQVAGSQGVAINPGATPTVTLTAADNGKLFYVNTANGPVQFNLAVAAANFNIKVKDVAGFASTNAMTLHRIGSESIEALAADYVMDADFGEWNINCDGTNYFLI